MESQKTLIIIVGNISAGKSTLCQSLQNHYGSKCLVLKEKFENNRFINKYYNDLDLHQKNKEDPVLLFNV